MAASADLFRSAMAVPGNRTAAPVASVCAAAAGEIPARGPGPSSTPAMTVPGTDVAPETMS